MKKVIHVSSYQTEDKQLFSGKDALQKAKEHQRKLNFMKNIKKLYPKAQKIFNLAKESNINSPDVDKLLRKFRLDESIWDIGNFEEFLYCLVSLYLEIPELSDFFKFIEKRFNSYNND